MRKPRKREDLSQNNSNAQTSFDSGFPSCIRLFRSTTNIPVECARSRRCKQAIKTPERCPSWPRWTDRRSSLTCGLVNPHPVDFCYQPSEGKREPKRCNCGESRAVVGSEGYPLRWRCSPEVPDPPTRSIRALHRKATDERPCAVNGFGGCAPIPICSYDTAAMTHSLALVRQVL